MRNMKNIGVTENICKKLKTLGYTFQKEQDKREKKNTHRFCITDEILELLSDNAKHI